MSSPRRHAKGDCVSRGRSVRGGMRAFRCGADPRGRETSGDHPCDEEEEAEEEEEEEEDDDDEGYKGTDGTG